MTRFYCLTLLYRKAIALVVTNEAEKAIAAFLKLKFRCDRLDK